MNFEDCFQDGGTLLELKYCERCGGLWLRPRGWAGVHCASCRACVAAMPDSGQALPDKTSRRKVRPPAINGRERRLTVPARINHLQGVAVAEVRL